MCNFIDLFQVYKVGYRRKGEEEEQGGREARAISRERKKGGKEKRKQPARVSKRNKPAQIPNNLRGEGSAPKAAGFLHLDAL